MLSVIIPCYNSGLYLPEAIASISLYKNKYPHEVIVVDDGSTDSNTLEVLEKIKLLGYIVIRQENHGPASARNTGVQFSKGKYLLFLDSDNKIKANGIDDCIEILESNPEIGVVYGNPNFFGDSTQPRFIPKEFNLKTLLIDNYIDVCSIVRKKVWADIGGFDEEKFLIGIEDWDFWIRTAAAGWKFYHKNEILYDYRIRHDSVIVSGKQSSRATKRLEYFYSKHAQLLLKNYKDLHHISNIYKNDRDRPLRSFFKYMYYKMCNKSV